MEEVMGVGGEGWEGAELKVQRVKFDSIILIFNCFFSISNTSPMNTLIKVHTCSEIKVIGFSYT